MLTEILIFILATIIFIPVCWYIGYRLLKSLGYQIVEINKDENDENNDNNDNYYSNLLDH